MSTTADDSIKYSPHRIQSTAALPPELLAKIREIANRICAHRYGEFVASPREVERAILEAAPLIVEWVAKRDVEICRLRAAINPNRNNIELRETAELIEREWKEKGK